MKILFILAIVSPLFVSSLRFYEGNISAGLGWLLAGFWAIVFLIKHYDKD